MMQTLGTINAITRCSTAGFVIRALVVATSAFLVCGCQTDQQAITGVPDVASDYRLRHPITISETDHVLEILIGTRRGALSSSERADVLAFAQTWRHEATGGILIDLPVSARNAHAAQETMREIGSILTASGVPPKAIVVRNYHPPAGYLATIRIRYPKLTAQAGPCGVWPEDIGPSFNRDYVENQPPWNFGCTSQRNLAAMVDNPADLVQPRGEAPAYTMRRSEVLERYKAGNNTATQYPSSTSISTAVGQ
jgi:pilus assembly protein CpaD